MYENAALVCAKEHTEESNLGTSKVTAIVLNNHTLPHDIATKNRIRPQAIFTTSLITTLNILFISKVVNTCIINNQILT